MCRPIATSFLSHLRRRTSISSLQLMCFDGSARFVFRDVNSPFTRRPLSSVFPLSFASHFFGFGMERSCEVIRHFSTFVSHRKITTKKAKKKLMKFLKPKRCLMVILTLLEQPIYACIYFRPNIYINIYSQCRFCSILKNKDK